MAKSKFIKKSIKDTKDSGFGKYSESTGGGHPFKLGTSNTRTTRENGKLRQSEGSPSQPRTEDGKFTYNSVNGKPLKDISKVNGKSRGTTVNPLLTGGENGIHFKEGATHRTGQSGYVKVEYDEKRQQKWENWAKENQWYNKGAEVVTFEGKIKLSPERLEEIAQEYDVKTKSFKGENIEDWKSKSGRHTKEEQAAIDAQKKVSHKGGRFVKAGSKPGEAEQVAGIKHFGKFTPKMSQPKPSQPAPQPKPAQPAPKFNFTDDEYNQAKDALISMGINVQDLNGRELDEFIDKYLDIE